MIIADKIPMVDKWSIEDEDAHTNGVNTEGNVSTVLLEHEQGAIMLLMNAKEETWSEKRCVLQIREPVTRTKRTMLHQQVLGENEDVYDEAENLMKRYNNKLVGLTNRPDGN